jgi:Domain of unknown function (DUF4397)
MFEGDLQPSQRAKGDFMMSAAQMTTARSGQGHSRRGVLRLIGAGAVVGMAISRRRGLAAAQTPYPTRIRVLHAAPGLGKVEVLFNGNEELDEFEYGMVSDWIEVSPGTVRTTIRLDRAGLNYVVFDAIAPVVANEDYELILSDPIIIPAPVDRTPLPADTSRVQVVHAAVDVPAIDIARKGGDVVIANLEYGQLSAPMEVPAGTYDLEARLTGTGEIVLDLPGVAVEPGMVYHLVIHGIPEDTDTPLTATTLADEAHEPEPAATPVA